MAPTAPTPRHSKSSKLPTRRIPSHRPNTVASSEFLNSKKDKRTIKHSVFVNRIEKAHTKPLKRRRPNKKLVTTLESLGDVLDGMLEEGGVGEKVESGKIRMRGLKSRPGAMKRKEKLERMERERFGKNLALLNAGPGKENEMAVEGADVAQVEANPTASRWAALRGFISQTLEQKEEFTTKA